jgi:hypothetical protein
MEIVEHVYINCIVFYWCLLSGNHHCGLTRVRMDMCVSLTTCRHTLLFQFSISTSRSLPLWKETAKTTRTRRKRSRDLVSLRLRGESLVTTQRSKPQSRQTATVYQFHANDILYHSIFDLLRTKPMDGVLYGKLIVNKFLTLCGTRRFITLL